MILKIALIFNLSWRKIIVSALQKLEELSTNEEMPDTLKMTMVTRLSTIVEILKILIRNFLFKKSMNCILLHKFHFFKV